MTGYAGVRETGPMNESTETAANRSAPDIRAHRETGALLLAMGGVAAAFGAASCCALPMLLGALGLGSVWLGSVAMLAAPHRLGLLSTAMAGLVAGLALLVWQRRIAAACSPRIACGRPAMTVVMTGMLSLGAVLAVLGFLFA